MFTKDRPFYSWGIKKHKSAEAAPESPFDNIEVGKCFRFEDRPLTTYKKVNKKRYCNTEVVPPDCRVIGPRRREVEVEEAECPTVLSGSKKSRKRGKK